MSDRWQQIQKICQSALELEENRRAAFIEQACADDKELRREVESLLKFETRDRFIKEPALEVAAKMVVQEPQSLIGQQLGAYQILSLLGVGGMGVVYKGRDLRLNRSVAIKVLPRDKMSDPDRKRRFIQEAKAASALNHPNIITVYDIGSENSLDFIVMEHVTGKTLDQRIPRKGMKLNEAIKLAIQIADALAKAHSAGIIHRDLKPSNVMVTDDGLVKVLDFGLAKLAEVRESEEEGTRTLPSQTEEGMIIGTLSYMSPEQAEGKRVDGRSDIFSFGAVLYEMVTGQKAFEGDSKLSTLAAIVKEEPKAVSQLVPGVPRDLEKIIVRCLRKAPERRWQSMADIKVALTEIKEESELGSGLTHLEQVASQWWRRRWIWATTFSVLVLAIGGTSWWYWIRPSAKISMLPMGTLPFTSYPGWEQNPAFSPDGNQVAFAWNGEKGDNYDIYVKLIDGGTALPLTTNPADEYCPAWSPDGRRIAFVRAAKEGWGVWDVMVISALGGSEHRLGQLHTSFYFNSSLSWSADGKFLATSERTSSQNSDSILLLSTETGEKQRLTSPPQGLNDLAPVFSPDSQALAFERCKGVYVGDIYVLPVAGSTARGEPRRLTFDVKSMGAWDWTPDGRGVVFSSNRGGDQHLWIVPVSGGEPERLPVGENAWDLSVARKGQRLVYQQGLDDWNIWRSTGPGPVWRPMKKEAAPTKFIASTKQDAFPQFSPDGKRIAFASDRSGSEEIWVCNNDGSNPVSITSSGGAKTGSPRWSPDGRQIAFDSAKAGSQDIYTVSAEGGPSRRLTTENSADVRPSWSKNGDWIYFGSNRTGDWQVWKIPSDGGAAIQVTRHGGREAFESTDGQWLYCTKYPPTQGIWRVAVAGGEESQVLDHGYQGLWAVLDSGVALARLAPESVPAIEFFSFATRSLTTIRKPPKDLLRTNWFGTSLAVSPDGLWILYAFDDRSESDLVMVENFR